MGLVAEFSLDASEFVFGEALESPTISRIEFDCNIPARHGIMPYFWVWGREFEEFESAIEAEPAVGTVTRVDELADTRLYRAEWRSGVSDLLAATQESNGVIQAITGEIGWHIEMRFDRHEDLQTFTDWYAEAGAELNLERLYTLSQSLDAQDDLTPAQREALVAAEQRGYYNEPSDVTMEELATELDISLSSVSGRLRRGTSKLIRKELL